MPTLVSELDLPELSDEGSFDQRHARRMELKDNHWLVRNMFGYAVLHYDDVTSILRDKRWHSAVSKIPQLMGITNPEFLERQQVSILSAEGDVHTRLRRLVAPAFRDAVTFRRARSPSDAGRARSASSGDRAASFADPDSAAASEGSCAGVPVGVVPAAPDGDGASGSGGRVAKPGDAVSGGSRMPSSVI